MREWIPPGWHCVTPRLVARDAPALVEFLRLAFDAKGAFNEGRPSELTIGDSIVMVSDGGGGARRCPRCSISMSLTLTKRSRAPSQPVRANARRRRTFLMAIVVR